ncbi:hypothetical protein R84B8_00045 [Treponema sp. R8-4-B8]
MNIIEAFDKLNKITDELRSIYWEISDNYRGPSDFNEGLSQFIETVEGQKLEKKLSELTDRVNSIIDEIIDIIGKDEVINKENVKTVNDIIITFANNFISINAKNWWFNQHNMDINERGKLNDYFEILNSKVRLLNKELSEKKDILNIITIHEAIDNIKNELNKTVWTNLLK